MAGNLHFDLRETPENRTLFTAHTDTVVRDNPDADNIVKRGKKGMLYATGGATLGADDGAGIAILGELMRAKVPAYYIFTRGEECGGHGAKHLAKAHAALLGEFDRAIAFDRRGYSDVITHQRWGRCASDAFAEALSDALNDQGLLYMPCDGGVYTDTAEFVDIIPECTNISTGYDHEHTEKESLDLPYLKELCAAALAINWDALPVARRPGENNPPAWDWNPADWKKAGKEDQDLLMPRVETEFDHDVCEACYSALEGTAAPLARLVSHNLGLAPGYLDESAIDAWGVMDAMEKAGDWREVLDMVGQDAMSMHEYHH